MAAAGGDAKALSKARLTRVSSRPVCGVCVSLGFEPRVAYPDPVDKDLLPRAAGEEGPAERRAAGLASQREGLAGQREGLGGRLLAGLLHARLHAELGDKGAQEDDWRRHNVGASSAQRLVRGGSNVAHVNTSGGRKDSGGAAAVAAAVAAAAGVAVVATGVAVVAAGAQGVSDEGDNGGGMGGGGAAGQGPGSLLVRRAAASNGPGSLLMTRGCTRAAAPSSVPLASSMPLPLGVPLPSGVPLPLRVPLASGVQRRLLESSANPRAERLGVRVGRGLNGLKATFVSGERVGVSGAGVSGVGVRGIRTGVSGAGAS